jgi:hypothetical protein
VTGQTYQIVVDNQTPSGTGIVASNGTGTAGRIDPGDTIQFTWSEPMAPASIKSGWTGTSTPITVYVESNNAANDEMYFSGLNLVLSATDLKLGGNFFASDVQFAATMVQSGNSITVTLGTRTGSIGSTLSGSTMSWRPSANAKDLAGKASATTTVTETSDRDF